MGIDCKESSQGDFFSSSVTCELSSFFLPLYNLVVSFFLFCFGHILAFLFLLILFYFGLSICNALLNFYYYTNAY